MAVQYTCDLCGKKLKTSTHCWSIGYPYALKFRKGLEICTDCLPDQSFGAGLIDKLKKLLKRKEKQV